MSARKVFLNSIGFALAALLSDGIFFPPGALALVSAKEKEAPVRLPVIDKADKGSKITIELEKKTAPQAVGKEREPEAPKPSGQPEKARAESFDDLKDPFESQLDSLPQLKDPFERFNRGMYKVNETLLDYVLDPLARGYARTVPEEGRVAVKNAFTNASSPASFVGSLAQGDVGKTVKVAGRLLINSTIGVGGMFDVARDHFGLDPVNEDFDRALGSYGIPAGPYIVLPFFGPSTARHAIGRAVDSLVNPTSYFAPFAASAGSTLGETVNAYSFNPDAKKDLDESAVDPYESVKHFYYGRRQSLIKE
ncbi:MAG: VacJ family lipoprotein [Nitrospinae bacterium]|nr:VacJ family lipoprotein [Nitrospinota bacterium]